MQTHQYCTACGKVTEHNDQFCAVCKRGHKYHADKKPARDGGGCWDGCWSILTFSWLFNRDDDV